MGKKTAAIYFAFVIVCVLGICIYTARPVEKRYVDVYGLTTDETIALTPEKEVSTEFTLTGDVLKGIYIKFQSENEFKEEALHASLSDARTKELLAEDTVQLKYERIQNKDGGSNIYVTLPVEEAKDRKVKLQLSLLVDEVMEEYTAPLLVTSEKCVEPSSLELSGKASGQYLVFQALYSAGMTRNVSKAVGTGILWLFILLLIFYAINNSQNQKAVIGTADRKWVGRMQCTREKMQGFVTAHRKVLGFLVLLFVSLILMVYAYEYGVGYTAVKKNYSFLKKFYAGICVLLLISEAFIYYGAFIKKKALEKIFVPVALSLGIAFSFVIVLNSVPDEPSHIDTAYSLSNEMLGIPASDKPGYIYKRAEDVDANFEKRQSLAPKSYKWLWSGLFQKAEDETLVECAARSNLGNAGKLYYVPQAVGLTIGRLLGLGMVPTLMLGRWCSLLAYVLLVYFAIKKLPVGKLPLFLIALLPISLQQAASFSYDGMINGIAFLYLGYCLYAIYGERPISALDVGILAVSGVCMATVKGGVYIAMSVLPLMMLWTRKKLLRKEKMYAWTLTGIFLFSFVNVHLISTIGRLSKVQGTAVGGSKSSEIFTFGYLLEHPKQLIGMFVNTFYKQGELQLRNLLGGNLAWRDVNISWLIVIGFLLLIVIACVYQNQERKIGAVDKCWMGLIGIGAFCCIELSMLLAWTPVTFNYITGVQGRYFLPFFLLALLVLQNTFFRTKRNPERVIMFSFVMLDVLTVLQVLQIVLEH